MQHRIVRRTVRLLISVVISCLVFASTAFPQFFGWRRAFLSPGLSLGINPLNPNTLYAEGPSAPGDFYVSHDRGNNWTLVGNAGQVYGIRQIIVHPSDTLTIFSAEGVSFVGLRKSTDGGATWRTVLPGYFIDGESMTIDPTHPDTMYAGKFDGHVYRSTDRGETWILMGTNGGPLCAMAVRPDSANIILSGRGSGHIVKSTDGGSTWRTVQPQKSGDEIPKIVLSPANPMTGYATSFGNDDDPTTAAWRTTDGGEHWIKTALTGVGIWSLALPADNPDIAYVGTFTDLQSAIFKTTNGGASWSVISHGLPAGAYSWQLKVHPLNPDVVWTAFQGTGAGIFKMISTQTGITGVVLDGATGDTIRAGTFRNLQRGGDIIDLRLSSGLFSTGFFDDSHAANATLHVESFPYYVKDTVVVFIMGSTITISISLDHLQPTTIQGLTRNRATHEGIRSTLSLSYTDPFGDHTIADSTDATGHFAINGLYPSDPPLLVYHRIQYQPELPFARFTDSNITLDSNGLNLAIDLDTVDVLVVGALGSGDYSARYLASLQDLGITGYAWNSDMDGLAPLRLGRTFRKKTIIYYYGDRHTSLSAAEVESLKTCLDAGCHLFLTGQDIVEKNATTDLIRGYLGVGFEPGSISAYNIGTPGDLFDGMSWFTTDGNGQTSRDRIKIVNPRTKPLIRYGVNADRGIAGVRVDCSGNLSNVILFGFGFEAISSAYSTPQEAKTGVLSKIFDYFESADAAGFSTLTVSLNSDWNLISVPLSISPPTLPAVFPGADSRAFGFQGNYMPTDTLALGSGYWVKFPSATTSTLCGILISADTASVRTGWNIVGSISTPLPTSSVTSDPPGLVTSQFFSYVGANYTDATTINPGEGYWVKVSGSGKLILSSSASAIVSARIQIVPTDELPPPAPTDADIEHPTSKIPEAFALEQNYPNPFNPETHFGFSVSNSGPVTLRVYDVLGRVITTIVNENLQPGEYTRSWDASKVPSGMYYYRLTAGTFIDTRKMLLLR